jgi:hypothetical protein
MRSTLFTLALAAPAAATVATGWAEDAELKARTTAEIEVKAAPRFDLNLDLPPKERWNDIAAIYKDRAYYVTEYLQSQLPPWAYDLLIPIAAAVEPYFADYGDEMIGLSEALGLDLGEIVATNMIYQLERIGVTCSNWNNTGPTLGDDAIPRGLSCDPDAANFYGKKVAADLASGPAGFCTSIVSQAGNGGVLHGRNLDWNIPENLKEFVIDVDVYQAGELLYSATGAVGFVGFLNGMRIKGEKWTVSQDARNHGGRIPINIAQALKTHCLTPEQAIRKVLESDLGANGFSGAVSALSDIPIVDDVYYVMSGEGVNDAAVITRDRNGPADVWRLGTDAATEPDQKPIIPSTNFWLTETNYDHWEPVPAADNRRDPANTMMGGLGSATGVNEQSMFGVMGTWPVFNPHTTFTSMMEPHTGLYNTSVWFGNSPQ